MSQADDPRGIGLPISTTLPPDVVRDLVQAAGIPANPTDPNRRLKAIERATKRAKAKYPQHFKE